MTGPEKSESLVPKSLTNDEIARKIFEESPETITSFVGQDADEMTDSQVMRFFADTAVEAARETITEIVNGDKGSRPLYNGRQQEYPLK